MSKTIEIFTDKNRFSDEIEQIVKSYACPKCFIEVHDVSDPAKEGIMESKGAEYGVSSLPAVVMDGKLVPLEKLEKLKRSGLSTFVKQLLHK